MLDSLEIKNFRSCQNATLRLGTSMVALLGKNGVGKTNVLHAIKLASDLCLGVGDSPYRLAGRVPSRPTEFTLRFKLNGSQYSYTVSRSSQAKATHRSESLTKDGVDLFVRAGEVAHYADVGGGLSGLEIGITAATLPSLIQILPKGHVAASALKPVAQFMRSIRYYPLLQSYQEHNAEHPFRTDDSNGEPGPFIERVKYEAWKADLAIGRPGQSVLMRLLHLWKENRGRFDELLVLLGRGGLGLVDTIGVHEFTLPSVATTSAPGRSEETTSIYNMVVFEPGKHLAGSGKPFSYDGLSAGTWRVIQLLTYMLFDDSTCMLVEQPEDSIHPGLLAKVIDILKAYSTKTQLICTTHSPRVMNIIGPSGIRIITANRGVTEVAELSGPEVEAAKSYIKDEGTLAEYLDTL